MAALPDNNKLTELLEKVKEWALKERQRLTNEKRFLESVRDGQGLASTTKNSKAIDGIIALTETSEILGL